MLAGLPILKRTVDAFLQGYAFDEVVERFALQRAQARSCAAPAQDDVSQPVPA